MRKFIALTLPLAVMLFSPGVLGQENPQRLTNQDVVGMVRAGLTPEVVIAKIKSSLCQFDTSPTALEMLKKEDVPNSVVLAVINAPASQRPACFPPSDERCLTVCPTLPFSQAFHISNCRVLKMLERSLHRSGADKTDRDGN